MPTLREPTASTPAATTPVSGTPAASAEPEAGLTSGLAPSPLAPLSDSGMQLGQRSANERKSPSQEGRASNESQPKAAAGENPSRPPQAVNDSEDSEARRKDPRAPAADRVADPRSGKRSLGLHFARAAMPRCKPPELSRGLVLATLPPTWPRPRRSRPKQLIAAAGHQWRGYDWGGQTDLVEAGWRGRYQRGRSIERTGRENRGRRPIRRFATD